MILKNALLNGKITDITILDGKIRSIKKTEEDGIDINGLEVIPGLIDIHSHGCLGLDTMDGKFDEMSEFLLKNGTTSWYPTTMTESFERIYSALNGEIKTNGCNILGFHMEGPYISEKYKGAQNEKYIKNPDILEFNKFPNVKIITLAPEKENSMEFIKKCKAVVSIGHTEADYETVCKAYNSGAKCLTHTFNAMPPFNHRNPSCIGAAITNNMYVQVICDGIHLHKAAVLALYKIFGTKRMILISDSMRATGMKDGEYEFGGQTIFVKDSVARTKDGNLAGSTSTLLSCVKTAISFGISKKDAIKMATKTPAKLMKLKKGSIKENYDADILVVDKDLNIKKIILNGKIM